MRSIQARFTKEQNKDPNHWPFYIFATAVKDQGFTQDSISREFTKLVPEEDYEKSDRRDLIKHLTKISNPTEDDTITEKNDR